MRGPLRYEVTTSSPQIQAGQPFSVFVKITNPYDVPAEAVELGTLLPVEFVSVESLARAEETKRLSEQLNEKLREQPEKSKQATQSMALTESPKMMKRFLDVALPLLPALLGLGGSVVGGIVAQSIKATNLYPAEPKKASLDEILKESDFEPIAKETSKETSPVQSYKLAYSRLQDRFRDLEAPQQEPITLQPGNSTVKVFTLRTTRSVLFSPSAYNLHIQSKYKVDGKTNQDSVEYHLSVRAPLYALILGSILGSIAGFLLRSIFDQGTLGGPIGKPTASTVLTWTVALIGNVLLGAIAVVAFARKKDAQPMLAIEDFWGGVFVGVVAGYSGKSLLNQFMHTASGPGLTGS
ncbi:MAG: hypothetical protein WCF30_13580 [Terracidiphilus sp.]